MPARRILIRLGSLGDVVLATGAAHAARELWGDASLDVLVKEEWREVWEGHPAVGEILAVGRRDRGLRGLADWGRALRRRGYAGAIDLQASPRTRILCAAAGLSARRPARHDLGRRLLARYGRWGPPPEYLVARAFMDCVNPRSEALPSMRPGDAAMVRAQALVPEAGGVGLVPGSRHATKRWPLERFVELGRDLAAGGRPPVVFFGPEEAPLREAWSTAWAEGAGWTGVSEGLGTTAACLSRLAVVVTNDTGLMHLAAAVGTPVVALFGPTVRSFGFTPVGPGHRVLEVADLECRPCSVHGGSRCPRGHFRCMLGLGAAEVEEAVLAALERGGDRRAAARGGV